MSNDAEQLEYLTIESVQWSTGHIRPRMALEDKRAKHRIHQRQFVLRQRERMEQLRRDCHRYKLQLMWLQAMQEATALQRENERMEEQLRTKFIYPPLVFEVPPSRTEPHPVATPVNGERISVDVEDENALMELLELLPDIKALDEKTELTMSFEEPSMDHSSMSPASPTCPFTMVETFY